MAWNVFRRSRRPEQHDVDVVGRCAAKEAAEQEAARRRLLDQAARCADGAELDSPGWNGPTIVIPSERPLLTRGGEHRAGGER